MSVLKHQAADDRKMSAALRMAGQHIATPLPPGFFLTDPQRTPDPLQIVPRLPAGCGVIYRHFGSANRVEVARQLSDCCRDSHRILLIAADPALAIRSGASGVHWPEARLKEALKWRGRFEVQTASAHSVHAVRRAGKAGVTAVLVSTIFASSSPSAGRPVGVMRLRRFAQRSRLPVYALGGLTSSNAGRVCDIAGIAAIEAFLP